MSPIEVKAVFVAIIGACTLVSLLNRDSVFKSGPGALYFLAIYGVFVFWMTVCNGTGLLEHLWHRPVSDWSGLLAGTVIIEFCLFSFVVAGGMAGVVGGLLAVLYLYTVNRVRNWGGHHA